ncbi:MAG: LamG-like jellyroll fold domain-containing protein, partial [Thomasclavelia sp.]|uniref:LamG-like jellyroll fold domain-containing protein n=1 Tax=Thomasclavelia sp. TaxID=3025757 RepID=UPI00399F06E6
MKSKIITVILSILMICGYVPVSAVTQEREFTSLNFNSSEEQFVSMEDNLDYIPNTIEVWLKLNNNQNKRQIIFGNYRDTTHPGFSIEITADNQLRYFEQVIENGKKIEFDIRTTDFSCDNQWTHISVVRDSDNRTISLLVNGVIRISKSYNSVKEAPVLSNAHFVGTDYRKKYFFDGEVHSISLWNQTKTPEEIRADMDTKLTETEDGLYHAWNFDDVSINVNGLVYDLVNENKINGTVSGYKILALEIQKLKETIKEYEQLIKNSNLTQEKKDAFIKVIEEVKVRLETATDLQDVDEINEKLQKAYSDFGKPEGGKLEFVVVTDTHVQSSASSESARIYDDGLNDIVTTMPNAKAVVNCGDFTSDGADSEFASYYNIIDKYDENLQFVNALGNHDVRWTSQGWDGVYDRYMSYNQKYMGDTNKVYYDTWIGEGEDKYHFVVINTEWDIKDSSYISNEQIKWLDKTMAEGAKDDKPIFVVLHEPLRNTIASTDSYNGSSDFPLDAGPQDYAIKEVLRKYPQSVILTGHVHPAVGSNEIIETDYGTLVNIPSYLRADSIGYYVSVYDGKVQLSMYDFEHDNWLPKYHYTIDLTDELPAGKVLDVTFDDKTANDVSGNGNHGTVVGNVEFVDGVKGKAVHIKNDEDALKASQYIDFGKVEDLRFGKDDFTIMFWYKGTKEMDTEGAIISNKNWDSGGNPGFAVGTFTDPRPGIGLNFTTPGASRGDTGRYESGIDGKWHHVAATFDRDGMMTLYIDGKAEGNYDISGQTGASIDVDTLSLVLGADGNKQYPINDGYIDELKIYKKVIEAYELESVVSPYKVEAGENMATVTWEALEDKFTPAYILFNGEKLLIPSDATNYEITGLTPNTKYAIEVITRDKKYTRNLVFGHELEFKTENSIKVDFEVLKDLIAKAEDVDKTQYTPSSIADLEIVLVEARALLDDENITQEEVDAALIKLQTAIDSLVLADKIETNKKALQIAIEMAKKVGLENVVPAVVNEFKAALENAKTVYDNAKASQEEVDKAFDRLASVMQMLEFYKGDKTALQKQMDQIAGLNANDYTEATWNAMQAVLPRVNEVLGNVNAMQGEVDEVYT